MLLREEACFTKLWK
uniref:Uncharacterized protein n=1 Tax=Anguilla anguilla TaxID=7936 RepID=A0A0E9RJN2_ANGAN